VVDVVVWGVRAPTRAIHANTAGVLQRAGALYMEAHVIGEFNRKKRTYWRLRFRDGKVLRRRLKEITMTSPNGGGGGGSSSSSSDTSGDGQQAAQGPAADALLAGLLRALDCQARSERNLQRERDAHTKQLADNQRQMAELQRQSQVALEESRRVHVESNRGQVVDLRDLLIAAVVGANPAVQRNVLGLGLFCETAGE
jgi:hypothetical protein